MVYLIKAIELIRYFALLLYSIFLINILSVTCDHRPKYNSFDSQSEPVSICNRFNSHKIKPFLYERWRSARIEVSKPPEFTERAFKLMDVYNFSSNVWIFKIDDTIISYAPIFKCGTEVLRFNFEKISLKLANGQSHKNHKMKLYNKIEWDEFNGLLIEKKLEFSRYPLLGINNTLKNANNLFTFTFVREPFQRFESGLAESVYRTARDRIRDSNIKFIFENTDQVQYYIDAILDFACPFSCLQELNHIFTASGVFFQHDIAVVGYLERFKQDLVTKVLPLYNLTWLPWDYSLGAHATSIHHPAHTKSLEPAKDPSSQLQKKWDVESPDSSRLRYWYKQLLIKKPVYARAICQIVLIDYVCLPHYQLPSPCEFLNMTRLEGMRILMS